LKEEYSILDRYIRRRGLRYTPQREAILKIFLSTERHLSVDELARIVKRRNRNIGYTTVYRTMKLLLESGLCGEVDIGDGITRFEHKYGHRHHDHLICTRCGRLIEVTNEEIERLQEEMVKKHDFIPSGHKLEIFGRCRSCRSSRKRAR